MTTMTLIQPQLQPLHPQVPSILWLKPTQASSHPHKQLACHKQEPLQHSPQPSQPLLVAPSPAEEEADQPTHQAVVAVVVVVVVVVEEYLSHQEVEAEVGAEVEAEVVEVEEVPQKDHHLPTEDLRETPFSNSQEIEKGAKHLCSPFKSIKE